MKRLTLLAMFAAATVAVTGCKKKDDANKASEKPAAGSTGSAAGSMAAPAGGSAAGSMAAPAGGSAAPADPAAGTMGSAAGSAAPADPAAGAPAAGGPAPTDAEFEAMMGKAVAMFKAMGDAADASGGDCGKLAGALEKVMADNKDFIEQAKKYKDNPDMDKKGEEWMKAHQDQVMGPMMKVAGAGQKCAGDAKFMAVMEKLGELGN